MGIAVSEYTPVRGNDKFVRLNSVTDLFKSGKVWAPDMRWAHEVIEQMAAFPNAAHDDLVDSSTQALIRFRQGGFLSLDSDEREESVYRRKARTELGAACDTGMVAGPSEELALEQQEWIDIFERAQLLLRVSPFLRARHQD